MKYFKLWLVNLLACLMGVLAYLETGDTVWIKAIVGILMLAATVTGAVYHLNKED